MKRARIAAVVVGLLVAFPIVAWAFGPMKQVHSQCLVCNRTRDQKCVIGFKIHDDIAMNQYSNWIDTFIPSDHVHAWSGSTIISRPHWFGGTMIGCGGIPTVARIFEQREHVGEVEARRLLAEFHSLVRYGPIGIDRDKLDALTRRVEDLKPK